MEKYELFDPSGAGPEGDRIMDCCEMTPEEAAQKNATLRGIGSDLRWIKVK